MRYVAVLLFLLLPLVAQAPADVIEAIRKEEVQNPQVQVILKDLVDGIGPRLTSSTQLTQACEWARDKFRSFGIASARTEEWGTFPVGFDRTSMSGRIVSPEEMVLQFTTPCWTPGTNGAARGRVVAAPSSLADLDAMGAKLKGTWLLGSVKGLRGKERSEAYTRLGLLGSITSAPGDLVITDGNHNITWETRPTDTRVILIASQYKTIAKMLEEGKEVEAEFNLDQKFVQGPIKLYNVLAEIPGTEKPNELVIVGGHIDSWDGARGTTDNGTGTATTIEAARLLMAAGAKPRRTIRFMLWSGEEQGLLGSRAYAQAHPEENARISAVLVHDGGTNYVSGISATAAMEPIFAKIFEPLSSMQGELKFNVRPVKSLPMGIGSDHDTYVQAGVPGFFWSQAGKANYTRTHHTQHDTFDAAIAEYQSHTSTVVAIGALAVANLPDMLPRDGLRSATEVTRGPRRTLGIQLAEEGDSLDVAGVEADGPGAKAGLKTGDVILKIGGKEVKNRFDMRQALRDGGTTQAVSVKRGTQTLELKVSFEVAK
ncbi:MAG: M20/M25/M40 family metallo-hydrolase [Planctomycetes bacterium]|nr:M20/M25/M40 family metallo-hydrolase [Planctomycetota bacterium]